MLPQFRKTLGRTAMAVLLATAATLTTVPADAQGRITPFMSAVAESAALDSELAAFYREKRPDCDRFAALENHALTLNEKTRDS